MQRLIYLDNNATTPCDPRVVDAMVPYFYEKHGNAASRSHQFGWEAEDAVDYAREQIAALLNVEDKEIIFTSGATESNNLALKGVFEMYARKGNHIITLETEHKAILDTCKHLEKAGRRNHLSQGSGRRPGQPGRPGSGDQTGNYPGVDHVGQQRNRRDTAHARNRTTL